MYSPKIREDLIPKLYIKAKRESKPMTKLVNDIIDWYFGVYDRNDDYDYDIMEIFKQIDSFEAEN